MGTAELKDFGKPDEVREFPEGRLELVKIGGATVVRAILEPGWRWATSVQPIAKTKSCEAAHFQYHESGVLRVRMDDGSEFDCRPGDVSLLPSGHDAWVIGDEPVIIVDFQGMIDYAKARWRRDLAFRPRSTDYGWGLTLAASVGLIRPGIVAHSATGSIP